jgi:hypothetical protein
MRWFAIAMIGLIAVFCWAGFATAAITTNIYVDSLLLDFTTLSETDPAGMWYQIEHGASAMEAAIDAGTFENMEHGTYSGTHNISVYDDVLAVTGNTSASGKAIMWFFDLKTDVAMTIQVREACTYTFNENGTSYVWDDVAGAWLTGGSTMTWQSIYNSSPYSVNIPLNAGDVVRQGWWEYINAANSWSASHLTTINYYVEYSADGGATWVPAASDAVNVVPEPATLLVWSLLGASSWLGMRVWRGGQRIGRRSWSPENRQAILEIVDRRAH